MGAGIDYGFHVILTHVDDKVLGDMRHAIRHEGVSSFKMFMAYPGVFMLDDASIFKALLRTGKNGGTICMHAENGIVINEIIKRFLADGRTAPKYHALTRPTIAEAEGVHRAIAIAEMAESPVYIVHLSCADALNKVREARDRGQRILIDFTGYTCTNCRWMEANMFPRPDVSIDKGRALTSLLAGSDLSAALYAGDDRTDVDAFRALAALREAGDLAVAVRIAIASEEAPPEVAAGGDLVVPGPEGFTDVLEALAE